MRSHSFLHIYQFIRAIRYSFLMNNFGFVSHCPTTPTCGTLLVKAVTNKQYKAVPRLLWKVITCSR